MHFHDALGAHDRRRVHEVAQGRPELRCERAERKKKMQASDEVATHAVAGR